MHQSLWRELWVVLGIVSASFVIGLVFGRPFLMVSIGIGLYIVSTLRHLRALHYWLTHRKNAIDIPDAGGVWGDIFTEIRKLVKQAGQREDRLTGMINRFQRAAEVMPDGVVILSQLDEIEWANRVAHRLLGINFPRDAGMRINNLLRDPEFTTYLQRGNFAEPFELPSPTRPDLTVLVQIVPYGSSQKMIVFRDITRVVHLEQMRRNFIANASHELRTPLTVLIGYLETLRGMDPDAVTDLPQHIETMHNQAIRMQRLVDDLLSLSRLETAPPRHQKDIIDIPALLATLKEQAEALSGAQQHRITLTTEPNLHLMGSREELLSAFSNLIDNAVRYTPRSGLIALHWFADNEGAKFSVRDSGEGISSEHIPYLTERFYRVDTARSRASGGTGLGLSIAKHALARHDAELRIESELGQGSTFTCIFPASHIAPNNTKDRTSSIT